MRVLFPFFRRAALHGLIQACGVTSLPVVLLRAAREPRAPSNPFTVNFNGDRGRGSTASTNNSTRGCSSFLRFVLTRMDRCVDSAPCYVITKSPWFMPQLNSGLVHRPVCAWAEHPRTRAGEGLQLPEPSEQSRNGMAFVLWFTVYHKSFNRGTC